MAAQTQGEPYVAERSARELIAEWHPRLAGVRDAWEQTLPPEASSEWPPAGAYVRESSVNSLHGAAADVQLRGVVDQMAQKRLFVSADGIFFDVESGTDIGPRSAFQRLFEECLRGGFKAIGVYVNERLFRNLEQSIQIKRQFRMHGIELVYMGQWEGDKRNPAAWQLEVMQDMNAELHAHNTSHYVGLHLEAISRAGRPLGRTPEVYEPSERAPSFLGRRGSVLSWRLLEPLASIMQEGCRRYLAGASFSDLAAWSGTTELAGLTPKKRVMHKEWWYKTLTNPKFAGYQMPSRYMGFKPGVESPRRPVRKADSELVPCLLPALWSLDDYRTILRLAHKRSRGRKDRRTYGAYLLAGVAYDAACGHRMRITYTYRDHYWMRCMELGVDGHHSQGLRSDIAARELDELIGRIVLDDQTLTRQIEEELRELARTAKAERRRFRINPAIGALRQALATLTQAGITDGRRDLELRLAELEADDERKREALSEPLVQFRHAVGRLSDWKRVWHGADLRMKNELLRDAGVRVELARLPGQRQRTPGHIIRISADNPAFEVAIAAALANDSGHRVEKGPIDHPMSVIELRLQEPWVSLDGATALIAKLESVPLVRPAVADAPKPHTIPPHLPGGPWLTITEFAKQIGRSRWHVNQLIKSGRIRAVSVPGVVGRWWMIHERELDLSRERHDDSPLLAA